MCQTIQEIKRLDDVGYNKFERWTLVYGKKHQINGK